MMAVLLRMWRRPSKLMNSAPAIGKIVKGKNSRGALRGDMSNNFNVASEESLSPLIPRTTALGTTVPRIGSCGITIRIHSKRHVGSQTKGIVIMSWQTIVCFKQVRRIGMNGLIGRMR